MSAGGPRRLAQFASSPCNQEECSQWLRWLAGLPRLVMRALLKLGQCLVGVEGRRRGQQPLKRGCARAPGIVARPLADAEVGVEHAQHEDDGAGCSDV